MKRLQILFLALLAGCASSEPRPSSEISEKLEAFNIRSNFVHNFSVTDERTARSKQVELHQIDAKAAGGRELQVSIYKMPSPEKAESLKKEKVAQILSVYDSHIDPYFALLTKATVCPEEFQPQQEEKAGTRGSPRLFFLFANDRNTIGACTKKIASRRAAIALVVCESNFIQVERYTPIQEWSHTDQDDVRSIDCFR